MSTPVENGAQARHTDAQPSASRCAYCHERDFSPSVECFEVLGELICEDCAEDALEDNGQFGVGA